ncbi:MAG: FG-GAP-like repeat-containing protein [Candidatus Eisenbacteria bacterium]
MIDGVLTRMRRPLVSGLLGVLALAVAATSAHSQGILDFTLRTVIPAPNPSCVRLVDFNGDGKLDLMINDSGSPSGTVSILLGNGDGTFQSRQSAAVGVSANQAVAGDLNEDGFPDVVAANSGNGGGNSVTVLIGAGDGTLFGRTDYLVGTGANGIALADMNRDGHLDIVTANPNSGSVTLLFGAGDGTFAGRTDYSVGSYPYFVAVADFNHDGWPDVSTAEFQDSRTTVRLGGPGGVLGPASSFATASSPRSVAVGDFNRDGNSDLILGTDTGVNVASLLLGNGDGTFQPHVDFATGGSPYQIAVADLDGDGNLDATVVARFGSLSFLLGNGDGTFQPKVDFPTGLSPAWVAVEDLNHDTLPDMAVANGSNDLSVSIFLNAAPAFGSLGGHVIADCPAGSGSVYGVTVDVYQTGSGQLVASTATDASGSYVFNDLPFGSYTASAVVPLGYSTGTGEVIVTVGRQPSTADFTIHCLNIAASPRSIGYWKHQLGVATGGRGSAEIDATSLCGYLDLISVHFNDNQLNPIPLYIAPMSGLCADKLVAASALLNLSGSQTMLARARQQLMALLLNVASGRLSTTRTVSSDGATVSQAITYCSGQIADAHGNYESAKTVADLINNAQMVPAGVIPSTTPEIAYRGRMSFRADGNPKGGARIFYVSVPTAARVSLAVYDVHGRRVGLVHEGLLAAGIHQLRWNGAARGGAVPSGVYFAKLAAWGRTETIKLLQLSE